MEGYSSHKPTDQRVCLDIGLHGGNPSSNLVLLIERDELNAIQPLRKLVRLERGVPRHINNVVSDNSASTGTG